MVSLLDITPTLLDWFQVKDDVQPADNLVSVNNDTKWSYEAPLKPPPVPPLTGQSLLSVLLSEPSPGGHWDTVYASHSLHEVTMYYPLRALRTRTFKLIQNINHPAPFPIDQDFYASPTFLVFLTIYKFTYICIFYF